MPIMRRALVEKPGWQIRGDPDTERLEFIQPNGNQIEAGSRPLDPHVRKRIWPGRHDGEQGHDAA